MPNNTPAKEIRMIAALWKSGRYRNARERYTNLRAGKTPAAGRKLWQDLETHFEDPLTFAQEWSDIHK